MTTEFNQQSINADMFCQHVGPDEPPCAECMAKLDAVDEQLPAGWEYESRAPVSVPRERYKYNNWNTGDEVEVATYRELVHFLVRNKGGVYHLITTALEEMRDSDREDFDMASFSSEAAVFLAKAVQAKLDKRGHIFGYQPGK
jgi:hypothetical protein